MSEETSFETPDEALSLPGTSMRQPPKATAAIVRPIVRPNRADMPPCIGSARSSLKRLERPLIPVGDRLVADPGVDRIRGRVREVGEEEAERETGGEPLGGEVGDERRRVPAPAVLRRRVDGADPDAARRRVAVRGQRDRAVVVPDEPGAVGIGLPAAVGRARRPRRVAPRRAPRRRTPAARRRRSARRPDGPRACARAREGRGAPPPRRGRAAARRSGPGHRSSATTRRRTGPPPPPGRPRPEAPGACRSPRRRRHPRPRDPRSG